MEMPNYDGLIEPWKVDLIVRRARLLGMRRHEIPDVLQVMVPDLMEFRYDPANGNGARERTVLTAVIDNRLRKMKRSAGRYQGHLRRFGYTQDKFSRDEVNPLPSDLADAVAGLTPDEQTVCRGLAAGLSRTAIAEQQGWGWHKVDRLIKGIREQFAALGLDGWVCP
ncbi:MAG TPA: hypothetical protein PK689_07205 [Kiritimatiellia bacterium]|nr:hypothetical protein [Kiritimatiellia bacterium]